MRHGTTRTARLRFGALALAALLALAACTSDDATTDAPAGVPESGPGTPVGPQLSGDLTIFAAASLQAVFDELTTKFEQLNPSVLVQPVTYDGSSTLATQLTEGASADVFASADLKNMTTVSDAGLVQGSPTVFTTNTLQIVVAAGNPKGITSLADLAALAASGGTVVLCAPEVPCGSAAHKALDAAAVTFTPASEEQNVKAVLTKVQTGDADAGLVYRTDVLAGGPDVEGVDFPQASAAVNEYPIAVLTAPTRTHDEAVAQAFVDLVLSPEGQQILADAGFVAP